MLFDVQVLQREGWTVLAVVGDVDLATLPALRQRSLEATGERVVLDLSGVDHLDPLAFGVLHALALRAGRQGGSFAVVCPDGRPRDLLAETGLDRLIQVVPALEELPAQAS